MTLRKYSKSSSFYLESKKDFFSSNKYLLEKAQEQNKLYISQPKRKNCKICNSELLNSIDFHSHNVDYVFCKDCNHLNGIFDDTLSYVESLYMSEDGSEYS